jgi:hydrogenase nickel incorporation protein HypB
MSKAKIEVLEDIYAENDRISSIINKEFDKKGIFGVNVLGSPGAGKTTTLIQLIKRMPDIKCYVVEGDIESDIDTVTLRRLGVDATQINTGGACHLDAVMIQKSIDDFELKNDGILFIENIGNLVCTAEFKIGEHIKMIIASVTEGSDKPYKYPLIFENADVILLNKVDLMPYVDFDEEFFLKGIRALNPHVPVFKVSGKTGEGFDEAAKWLETKKKSY